ncbi:hypothetical protein ILUMI_20537 [Ignelater luminosus]|uniref:Uncharacterized protein n=1 Tax=Ignelater luminosus TaxID=2038154 RepID=A0A8K0CI06_IGNLU|nr:hypothetical protein ILUMI_20537 [Ignelater luminosus]
MNPGLWFTQFQMSQLIAEAYAKAATIEKLAVENIPDTASENKENIEESELEEEVLENCETDTNQLQVSIEEILPILKVMPKITRRIERYNLSI